MDTFWTWLMRANARAVLGVSLVALAVVLAWWGWRELAPPADYMPSGVPRAETPERLPLGLLARIEREASREPAPPKDSPFVDRGRRVERPRPPRPDPPRLPRPLDDGEGAYTEPPPRRLTVTLEFRGLLQSSDGVQQALIHDGREGSTRFRRIGDTLYGFRLEAIDVNGATLRAPSGAHVPLPIRVPQTIDMPAAAGSP